MVVEEDPQVLQLLLIVDVRRENYECGIRSMFPFQYSVIFLTVEQVTNYEPMQLKCKRQKKSKGAESVNIIDYWFS